MIAEHVEGPVFALTYWPAAQASMMLYNALGSPLVGLRTLNPHIVAAISATSDTGPALPRELAPAAVLERVAGVSSFAFQASSPLLPCNARWPAADEALAVWTIMTCLSSSKF